MNRILARRERDRRPPRPRTGRPPMAEAKQARWQSANEANLLAGRSSEYTTPAERSAFYHFLCLHRHHETTRPDPPAATGLRRSRQASCWSPAARCGDGRHTELRGRREARRSDHGGGIERILRRGNQVIMDDVFPKLRDLLAEPAARPGGARLGRRDAGQQVDLVQPALRRCERRGRRDPAEHRRRGAGRRPRSAPRCSRPGRWSRARTSAAGGCRSSPGGCATWRPAGATGT